MLFSVLFPLQHCQFGVKLCVFQNTHTHFSALIQLLPVDVRHNFEQDIDLVVKHTEPLEMNTGCGSELRMNTLIHEQRKWMTKLC